MNVCLLIISADKLSALCGSPGQYEPLSDSHLKDKASSVMDLQDVLENEEDDQIQTPSGIAGSGNFRTHGFLHEGCALKSTAFMEKAPHEWAKGNPARGDHVFWPHIALFLRGSLTNKKWWKAQDLVEIFGLARSYSLAKEEEGEVVRFIKSHSQQVLLVADALDEATVDEDSLLWEILTGIAKISQG